MRTFRSNRENLRDTRTLYTLLLSVTVIAVLLAAVVTALSAGLHDREVSRYYESLTLCSDALAQWKASSDARERYSASLRFERAAATLPDTVPLDPLMSLADHMRMGEAGAERVNVYADGFAFLSSREYADAEDAKRVIGETLGSISSSFEDTAASRDAVLPAEEILRFTRDTAKRSMKTLLGSAAQGLELFLSEETGTWRAEAENLRIDYSCENGSLEEMVYIRVGDVPNTLLTEADCADRALSFYLSARGSSSDASILAVNTSGGFCHCEIADGDERWQICVDAHGRVWSFMGSGE